MTDKQSTWKRNLILFVLFAGIAGGVGFALLRQNPGQAQAQGTRQEGRARIPSEKVASQQQVNPEREATTPKRETKPQKIVKTDAEWRKALSPEAYRVTRRQGTERAFTGKYWNNKKKGVYTCVCCEQPLFDSKTKYKSGTGWPSFWAPIKAANVGEESDRSFFMVRTEVHCSRCDAHLGHVFDDGPDPTGLRYCINSVSLKFVEKKDNAEKK